MVFWKLLPFYANVAALTLIAFAGFVVIRIASPNHGPMNFALLLFFADKLLFLADSAI